MDTLLTDAVLILLVATSLVAILHKLNISPIIAFLLTGVLLGSHGFHLVQDSEGFKLLAELGVVFLMFLVGLEFSISKILALKHTVFVVGGLQLILCSICGIGLLLLFDLSITQSAIGSLALVMSSTALVLQSLSEQNHLNTRYGKHAVAILLCQDIATIPLLVMVTTAGAKGGLVFNEVLISLGLAAGLFFIFFIIGKFVLTRTISYVILTKSREFKLLTILSITLGSALFADIAGASMPIGAFLAGLIIGETGLKSEIEKDVLPFRDILLGLFFVTLGTEFNFMIIKDNIGLIISLIMLLTVVKGIIIALILKLCYKNSEDAFRSAIALAQGGEFGLLIISYANINSYLADSFSQCMIVAIIMTMAITPVSIGYNAQLAKRIMHFFERLKTVR